VVKIRFGDFQTITRAAALPSATDRTTDIWTHAKEAFDKWAAVDFQPVRLIGVTATRLTTDGEQLDLFNAPTNERQRRLDGTLDQINARFGKRSIHRGGATD